MSAAGQLALKLVLTPVLVGAASLVGRRWGPAVGGWLIGLPFTSAPVAFFLALDPGPAFAREAALGIMAGAISQAAFCLGYAWAATRLGWAASIALATLAFGVLTALLRAIALPATASFVVIIVAVAVALFLLPDTARVAPPHIAYPRWDLPARMIVATAFVVVLTAAAPLLGARLAGLIAPFPLYGAVLAAFAQHLQGAEAGIGVVRGLLLGLFAFASFFFVLYLTLPTGIAIAFVAAITVALVVQAATLLGGRRLGLA